jgi:hypothetical protein
MVSLEDEWHGLPHLDIEIKVRSSPDSYRHHMAWGWAELSELPVQWLLLKAKVKGDLHRLTWL